MSNSLAPLLDQGSASMAGVSLNDEYCYTAQRYHWRLCATAFRIVGNQAEAEDVVQEAHVHALSHLNQFEGRASLKTWLTQIVINEALIRLRRRGKSVDLDTVTLASRVAGPEEKAVGAQLGAVIAASVRSLPAQYRSAFFFREICDMSGEEAAMLLGITVGCMKTRLHRAKALLRTRLQTRLGYRECKCETASVPHRHSELISRKERGETCNAN